MIKKEDANKTLETDQEIIQEDEKDEESEDMQIVSEEKNGVTVVAV